jgi:hypothetical protein
VSWPMEATLAVSDAACGSLRKPVTDPDRPVGHYRVLSAARAASVGASGNYEAARRFDADSDAFGAWRARSCPCDPCPLRARHHAYWWSPVVTGGNSKHTVTWGWVL